jgi:hypothetical protein
VKYRHNTGFQGSEARGFAADGFDYGLDYGYGVAFHYGGVFFAEKYDAQAVPFDFFKYGEVAFMFFHFVFPGYLSFHP